MSMEKQDVASELKLPLRTPEIMEILPHRYPFLLVDKVTEFVDRTSIQGVKNITINEPFFVGHFPGRPIMPGVLILEAMAQLGALFAKLSTGGVTPEKLIVFSGADDVRFRHPVVPGDILVINMQLIKAKFGHWKMSGQALVGTDVAAEGILKATEVL